jgi:hypothetical protein
MRLRLAAVALAVCGALWLPATAGADVRSELAQASAALDAAINAADAGDSAGLAAQLAANATHTDVARRQARGLSSLKQRARWAGRVGQQYEDNLTQYLFEVSFVDPSVQPSLANAFATNLLARERVVSSLSRMLPRLPDAARARALDMIGILEAAGDIEAMLDTVLDPDVIGQAKQLIVAQVTAAVAHMQATIDRLDTLVDRLPPEFRAYVHDALEQISTELGAIPDNVDELIDGWLAFIDEGDLLDFGPLCAALGGLPFPVPVPVCN